MGAGQSVESVDGEMAATGVLSASAGGVALGQGMQPDGPATDQARSMFAQKVRLRGQGVRTSLVLASFQVLKPLSLPVSMCCS